MKSVDQLRQEFSGDTTALINVDSKGRAVVTTERDGLQIYIFDDYVTVHTELDPHTLSRRDVTTSEMKSVAEACFNDDESVVHQFFPEGGGWSGDFEGGPARVVLFAVERKAIDELRRLEETLP